VRRKLKQFPEIVEADIDTTLQRATMEALPSFDQYVALAHALEEAGGAIQMFHPRYLLPQAHYASLGAPGRDPEALERLRQRLQAVPGVRSAIIDTDRWFINERGLEVGGAVVFAEPNPRLNIDLVRAAKKEGFIYEPKEHGHAADEHDEWSEMNHAFAGLCLVFLAAFGILQTALPRPPWFVKYGTVFVWLALFVFLFVRADRGAWPLGPMSWWESFQEWDTAQHRVGVSLILAIAVGDFLRVCRGWKVNPAFGRWGVAVIGLVGSGMLFTHLHSSLDPAHAKMVFRMNAQHLAMATCALLFAVSKFAWETWRVPRWAGQYLWLVFLGCLGLALNLYVE